MSDVEQMGDDEDSQLQNRTVKAFLWEGVKVSVKHRHSNEFKDILRDVNGVVAAGNLLAIMGPSGSGKSTLLNVLARRKPPAKSTTQGKVYVDRTPVDSREFRRISAYVEQEDALIGSLTVRETLEFAARLSLPTSVDKSKQRNRVEELLQDFGLSGQASNLVGTSIKKGISGGQKRRLSVAAQLITAPKVLFLDEPTSGLDSAAAFEVISFLKDTAKKYRLVVIASMHQPSFSTFVMCDKVLLLSRGQVAYNGQVADLQDHFRRFDLPIPQFMNPAEFVLDFLNTDFARDEVEVASQLHLVQSSWLGSDVAKKAQKELDDARACRELDDDIGAERRKEWGMTTVAVPMTLIQRSFIKSYRDIIAYQIRIVMYLGLALMMGTVWLRLEPTQDNIQSFINAIFFGGAFMSFMAVAYIPAFLEDHAIFVREQANGFYGPTSFLVANFVVGIPYLLANSVLFSLVVYWLSNFRSGAGAFFTWTGWLFLDLVAAESLVVLISSLIPIFVVALAGTAFANGLWMCTGGFLVPPNALNPFWRYLFHYIDYQSYVFRGMMVNEFGSRNYSCASAGDGGCSCMYQSDLTEQCLIEGSAVLDRYGYGAGQTKTPIAVMFVIIAGYRGLGWLVVYLRTR